jgi:hypothetical protein
MNPRFLRSSEPAHSRPGQEISLTLSYALRHLGIAEHRAGHLDQARSYLEESTRLRRQQRWFHHAATGSTTTRRRRIT